MYGVYVKIIDKNGNMLTGRDAYIRPILFKTRKNQIKLRVYAYFDQTKHIRFRDVHKYDKVVKLKFNSEEIVNFVYNLIESLKGDIITSEMKEFILEEYPDDANLVLENVKVVFDGSIHIDVNEQENYLRIKFVKNSSICLEVNIHNNIEINVFCDDDDVRILSQFIYNL